jgi:hypothetical protein
MREAEARQSLTPVETHALVVFVRPDLRAEDELVTITDGEGRFLGESLAATTFAVHVLPGEHLFVGWAENTPAMRATVEAGKTYFVRVTPLTEDSPPQVELRTLSPRRPKWKEAREWIAQSRPLVPDEAAGQRFLEECADDVQLRIRQGKETLAKAKRAERSAWTIRPGDGV